MAGTLRHELVLTLLGAVLLAVWGYCLLAVLFLSIIHRKRAVSLSVRMPEPLGAGQPGAILCIREHTHDAAFGSGSAGGGIAGNGKRGSGFTGNGRFFRLPGILVRYKAELCTKDGRRLDHVFDPDFLQNNMSPFNAPGRGAYYGKWDKLLIFDIVGLFHAAIAVPQMPGPRLLVMPQAAEQAVPLSIQSGGSEQRIEPYFLRTDDLIDHRPYVPGDDPRRINWKLYGHAGDLFVREGEPEPPPHSKLLILIDTQADPGLYTAEAGRRAVDLLCENTLAIALDYTDRGMDVRIGYSGGGVTGGGPAELAVVLAHPAVPFGEVSWELPQEEEARSVLILALPRDWIGGWAADNGSGAVHDRFIQKRTHTRNDDNTYAAPQLSLDRFLKKRNSKQAVDILFLYGGEDTGDEGMPPLNLQLTERRAADENKLIERLQESAEACVRYYNGKGGVCARHIRI
jgi:hypothetical protein